MRLAGLIKVFICILSFISSNAFSQKKGCKDLKKSISESQYKIAANNSRSDSIDILNYHISLNISNFSTKIISGFCTVKFSAKVNAIAQLDLDLLKLTVDSIKQQNNTLIYTYNDTLLRINLNTALNSGDVDSVKVYYHGVPKIDGSGWGGFYFTPTYAYNLGVGFDANPHNYGRVWFPCFDNFVERSTYRFSITTAAAKKAACNGVLVGHTINPNNSETWNWQMNETIPTYLACVAISAYKTVHQTFTGINGPIPVELQGVANDTNNIKASFIHLENAFDTYEQHFGAYSWSKIGYSFVPFNSGAMEHATNVTYPRAFANGSLNYETIMAHEFAHHWWGDLVTCSTAEDMWINEGMASYCEDLFVENLYGKAQYLADVRSNLTEILHFAHHKEGGYRAISGLPHELTYGDHVYLKGKSVAHSLRGYMGDSLFFSSMKSFLNASKFSDVSSVDMRNGLELSSGLDLHPFFDNWVFSPGFPHFSIDSVLVSKIALSYDVKVALKQKLTGAPNLYQDVPLEITWLDSTWMEHHQQVYLSGKDSIFSFMLPFEPKFTAVNYRQKLADAVSCEAKVIKTTGVNNFANALMSLNIAALTDSVFLRIEHNWTAPDSVKDISKNYILSPNRYWKVDGIVNAGFNASANITYNGLTSSFSGNNYLDNGLITGKEDSLVLLYRRDAADDWNEYTAYVKNMGNPNDKTGIISINSLQLGEYCLALKNGPLNLNSAPKAEINEYRIYPNPAGDKLNIEMLPTKNYKSDVDINDSSLRLFESYKVDEHQTKLTVNTEDWPNGIYFVIITQHSTQQTIMQKVIISHQNDSQD